MQTLFDTSDFPARWHCGNWTSLHGWIHIAADIATAVAYFAIPAILVYFIRKREEIAYRGIFWLFALFILSCGTVHLIEATIFWWPVYRVSALFKVLTATISITTAIALTRVMPVAVKLPGRAAMAEQLEAEVAQRERTEEALRQRNYDLDQFAGMASHDLKAPLHAIRSLALIVEEDELNVLTPGSRQNLHRLRDRVDRMDELLNGLLEFTRAGAAIHGERLDLKAETLAVIELLDVPAGCSIECADLPEIVAPRAAVRLILRNLIGNSLKHGGRSDQTIRIHGRIEGDDCVIEVEDNGPGVPEGDRERIFDMFVTAGPEDSTPSTGMGLAAVRRAATALRGRVWLNPGTGDGATFVLRLPRDFTAGRRERSES